MLDAKTIYGTLMLGLIGCASSNPQPDPIVENTESPVPTDTAPVETTALTSAPPDETAVPTPSTSAIASSQVPGTPLPMGRAEPLPPADHKPVVAAKSTRTGADACCGKGTCGACAPLPAGAEKPKPPKAGPVVTKPKESKRTGAATCCGEGTCGPC